MALAEETPIQQRLRSYTKLEGASQSSEQYQPCAPSNEVHIQPCIYTCILCHARSTTIQIHIIPCTPTRQRLYYFMRTQKHHMSYANRNHGRGATWRAICMPPCHLQLNHSAIACKRRKRAVSERVRPSSCERKVGRIHKLPFGDMPLQRHAMHVCLATVIVAPRLCVQALFGH